MPIIHIHSIIFPLNLYFSYLLPLFKISTGNELIIYKEHGVCKGLLCSGKERKYKCIVPSNCSIKQLCSLLGIDKKIIARYVFNNLDIPHNSYLYGFSLIYSQWDKLYIIISIYLSRNTNYFLNTIHWVKKLLSNKCYIELSNCEKISNSYIFREFIENYPKIHAVLSSNKSLCEEIIELARIKGIGVKSIMAYILHAYGETFYAPIDRYYFQFLKEIGIKGKIPSIDKCRRQKFNCRDCIYRDDCLYGKTYHVLGLSNGFLQSLSYIYYRLKNIVDHRIRTTPLEDILLSFIDIIQFINEFEDLVENLKQVF